VEGVREGGKLYSVLPPIATDLPAASLQESNLRIKDLQLNTTKNTAEVTELQTSVSSLPSILLSQEGELKAAINSRLEGIHSFIPDCALPGCWYVVLVLCLNDTMQLIILSIM
jgi:hypothetical protein